MIVWILLLNITAFTISTFILPILCTESINCNCLLACIGLTCVG